MTYKFFLSSEPKKGDVQAPDWDTDAVLRGHLDRVPTAPSNVVKIYIVSTKSGERLRHEDTKKPRSRTRT